MLAWQRFSEWRLAQKLWHTTPALLPADRQRLLQQQLARQLLLEQAVVEHAQRDAPALTSQQIQSLTQDLEPTLMEAGFSATERAAVIQHHLLMEGQMALIAAQAPPPTAADVENWYQQHAAHCRRPEQRLTRHLLLTTDEANEAAVNADICELYRQLQSDNTQFARVAERHSQCPTALEGGLLGWISRGLLFASLEPVLFRLQAGELSTPVASEMGWHLLLCEAIRPETPLPREEALPNVYAHLLQQRQREQQRQWLAGLVGEDNLSK